MNQVNKASHHHLDGKCRVPTTVLETTKSQEPIVSDAKHDSMPVTVTTHVNSTPISTSEDLSPHMVDL